MSTIHIHPLIAREVRERKQDTCYRLYVLAKAWERCGEGGSWSGKVAKADLIARAADALGLAIDTVQRTIGAGDGTYWTVAGEYVYLPSPDRLARRLGLPHAGKRQVEYPVSALGGIRRFRALLFDAQLPRDARRMARETLHRETGVSPTTQQRWERDGVAAHTDGRGRAPVGSPAAFYDFTDLVPSHNGAVAPVLGVITALAEDGKRGFFGTRKIFRQAPKHVQSTGTHRRRHVNRKFQLDSPSFKAQGRTRAETVSVNVGGGRRTRARRNGLVAIGDTYDRIRPVVAVATLRGKAGVDVFNVELAAA